MYLACVLWLALLKVRTNKLLSDVRAKARRAPRCVAKLAGKIGWHDGCAP